ncbi:hypothetical protein GGS24DRAFT_497125 [Hypoxylon argillaceum]|nr:hypothetical protein GGS24DRAFT_497125 [Hypoxylon argillaceum]
MPAINTAIVARDAVHQLARRENCEHPLVTSAILFDNLSIILAARAQQEAGVIVVFAIVFVVGVGLLSLFISRLIKKRNANKVSSVA